MMLTMTRFPAAVLSIVAALPGFSTSIWSTAVQ